MAEKMKPADAVKKIFETLTGQIVDPKLMFFYGKVIRRAEYCPDEGDRSELKAELGRSLDGVLSLRIYYIPDEKYRSLINKGYTFRICVEEGPKDPPAYLVNSLGSDQNLCLGHWSTMVCPEVLLLYYRLVNGSSGTLSVVQPVTRDEQARFELASSASKT